MEPRLWRRRAKKGCLVLTALIVAFLYNAPIAIISTATNAGQKRDFRLEEFTEERLTVDGNEFAQKTSITLPFESILESCPQRPPDLVGEVATNSTLGQEMGNPRVFRGGSFQPVGCTARYKVAIIIPIRNREIQLRTLLNHMHFIWQRQQMDYTVYAVTQAGSDLFNRAKLMNAGVAEAIKEKDYDCYVFQDTDLLLEDDRCLYWCDLENPRHLARHVDVFEYKALSYILGCMPGFNPFKRVEGFGGVSMLTKKQFEDVNGYSNLYWGWGGEDDDMFLRLYNKGYTVANPYGEKCSYGMIKHERETTNRKNDARYALLYHSLSRAPQEGFSTLRYRVLSKERRPLYTNITVDIGKPSKEMIEFMTGRNRWITGCAARMPWN